MLVVLLVGSSFPFSTLYSRKKSIMQEFKKRKSLHRRPPPSLLKEMKGGWLEGYMLETRTPQHIKSFIWDLQKLLSILVFFFLIKIFRKN